jgi:hypothetical protein
MQELNLRFAAVPKAAFLRYLPGKLVFHQYAIDELCDLSFTPFLNDSSVFQGVGVL